MINEDRLAECVACLMVHAANTPAADWHLRYRSVNRAAGMIAGYAVTVKSGTESAAMVAQRIANLVHGIYVGAGETSSIPDMVADLSHRRTAEQRKLFAGLLERVAATLVEVGE